MRKRQKQITIRVDDTEYRKISDLAQKLDKSISQLLRDHLGKLQVRDKSDERQRLATINRLNANLNMIAKWCNRYTASIHALEVQAELISLDRRIKHLLQKWDKLEEQKT